MHSFSVLAGLLAIGLGWNLPNHYPLWTTFHSELVSAIGLCLLFIGVLWRSLATGTPGVSASSARVPLPGAAWVWLCAALIPLLQYAAGGLAFRGDALLGWLYGTGVALGLYTGHLWARQVGSKEVVKTLFVTIVFAALAAGALALVQWQRLPTPSWWSMELIATRPFGNFAQPNLFALLMVMGIVSATMLFEAGVLQSRLSHALTLLFFGWCLLISESRANAFGMLAIAVVWFATRHRVPSRLRVLDVLLALAIGYLVYQSLGTIENALLLTAAADGARPALEVGPRRLIWLHFATAILERPWFGYGFGQGVMALREVAASVQPSYNTIYAHNVVLDLMIWFGIPLGAGLSLALGLWMVSWLRRQPDAALSVERHGVFALWLALLCHAMLEFPHAHAFFLLPAALLAGAVMADTGSPPVSTDAASRPALVLAAVSALLLAATTVDYFRFEAEFRSLRFEKANFIGREAREEPPPPWVLDQLGLLNESAHFEPRPGMPPEQIDKLGRLARRFHLLPTRFTYAKALALNGRMPEAEHELMTIRSLYRPAVYASIERDWQVWLKQNPSIRETSR